MPKNEPSKNRSFFERLTREERDQYRSPEAQRLRNEERRAKRDARRSKGYGSQNEDIDSNKGEDEPVKFGQNSDGTNDGGGGGGGGGGGDGDGFELITFDVVNDDNTTSQYQWRAEEV